MTLTADAKRAVQETIKELGGVDVILANAVSCGLGIGEAGWVGECGFGC